MMFEDRNFNKRIRQSLTLAWQIFQAKVGNGLIQVDNEASMQLNYAYILQSLLPLLSFEQDENTQLELEKNVKFDDGSYGKIDLFLTCTKANKKHRIAVEMKCYRERAASGSQRGATDIFMKDVYVDLQILEDYIAHRKCEETVFFALNDLKRLVYPKDKTAKCWAYDISNDFELVAPLRIRTPIGGKNQNISIRKPYKFKWQSVGSQYFLEL